MFASMPSDLAAAYPGQVRRLPLTDLLTRLRSFAVQGEELVPLTELDARLPFEEADLYALSAYAEALLSEELDGDLWGTLADLEAQAPSEEVAWERICHFYLERGATLLILGPGEEWLFASEVLRRLGLEAGIEI